MPTYFCLDVSGSMSTDHIKFAIETINSRSKQGDFVVLFDCMVHGIWPVEDVLGKVYADPDETIASLCKGKGRGGTDPSECYQSCHEHAQHHQIVDERLVLLSDGYFMEESKGRFDEFICIDPPLPQTEPTRSGA